MRRSFAFAAAVGFLLVSFAAASAQTWNGPLTGTTNWSAGTWSPSTPPFGGGTGVSLFFVGGNGSYIANNDLGNPFVLNSMNFGNFTTGTSTFGSLAGNSLELGGASPVIGAPQHGGVDQGTPGVAISSALNLNPASGGVTFGGAGLGVLSVTGVVSSTGSVPVTIVGNATLPSWSMVRLMGANTYTGNTTIASGGHLFLGNNTSLGAGGNILIVSGGTLSASAVITVANNITLNADLVFNSVGNTMTHTGVISGNFAVRQTGFTSSSGGLTLQGANTYTGETILDVPTAMGQITNTPVVPGVMTVSGASGALANTSAIRVRAGGTFTLNDVTAFAGGGGGRVNDAANVFLGGGLFNVTGGAVDYSETMGGLTLQSGNNAITMTPTATGGATATFASLTRANQATVLFRGTNLGNAPGANVGTIAFTAPPTADLIGGGGGAGTHNISILPYAAGGITTADTGSTLVTIDTGRVRPLSVATEYDTSIVGGSATANNIRLTASQDIASVTPTTVNALVMTTGTLSNSGGGSLRLTSGTFIAAGASTISAPLDFGTREAIVYNNAAVTISGSIDGTGGLTKAGSGTLTLSGSNNYSGTTTLNGGVISIASGAGLGNSATIVAGGPTNLVGVITRPGLTYTGAAPLVLAQNITVNSGFFAPNASGTGTLQFDGVISGAGGVYVSTISNVILNGANTYTGMTRVFGGNIAFSSDANLGNGGMFDIGSNVGVGVVLNGNWTTSRPVNLSFSSNVNTQGFNWTQNGPFTGSTSASLTKNGAGTWNLNTPFGSSSFAGAITITTGRLNVNGYLAPNASLTVSSAAVLGGTGEIDRPVSVSGGGILSPGLSPGQLLISSRAAPALTFSANSIFEFEINDATGAAGVNWDRVVVSNSSVSLPSAITLRIIGLNGSNVPGVVPNFNNANTYTWEFINAASFTGNAFNTVVFNFDDQFSGNNPLGGGSFSVIQNGANGIALRFTGVAVPEPTTIALLGVGLTAGGFAWRRRRTQQRLAQAQTRWLAKR